MQGEKASSEQGLMGFALLAIIFIALILVGVLIFLASPPTSKYGYFWAYLETGIFALILGIIVYFSSALTKGNSLRIASTGCFWFGVVMLLAADLATPDSAYGGASNSWTIPVRLPFLIIILVIIAIGIGIQMWHTSSQKSEDQREEKREEWRRSTQVVAPGQERR